MTADAAQLRFYVDESALGLGKVLEIARKDTIHVGHRLIPECPRGSDDPDWIPAVAARDLIVIIRDKRIRTRPAEIRAFRDAGLRVFSIGGKRDAPTWTWLTWLVRHWDGIEQIIGTRDAGPWLHIVSATGIIEVDVQRY